MKRRLTLEEVDLYKLRIYKCDYKRIMQERIGAGDRQGKPAKGQGTRPRQAMEAGQGRAQEVPPLRLPDRL